MRKWAQLAMGTSAALACMGMAFGQDYSSPTTTETTTSTYTSTTTTSTSSSAPAAPRTGLYTSVTKGNAAADKTVDDYSRRPTLIGDRQYFAGYGGVELADAAASLRLGSLNWFTQVTAGTAATVPATIRLGAGTSGWGGGVIMAVNRTYVKTAPPSTETTTLFDPSGFGLFGDLSLGSSDIYGQVAYNTGLFSTPGLDNSVHTVAPAPLPEDDDKRRTLGLMVGWKKDATTEGTHALNVEAVYQMAMEDLENPTADATDTRVAVIPAWGYIFKASSDYSVFLGANGLLDYIAFETGNTFGASVSPNIALHKQLSQRFEGFAGFSVTGMLSTANDRAGSGSEGSTLMTGGADVAVGLRWVKDNLALEGSLKETVLANGPYLIGGNAGQGFFLSVGLSMGI